LDEPLFFDAALLRFATQTLPDFSADFREQFSAERLRPSIAS
jgi:hypothetical protein